MTKPILLSTREVAARKGTTTRQVQRVAAAGLIPVAQVGPRNTMYFKASDVRTAKMSLR